MQVFKYCYDKHSMHKYIHTKEDNYKFLNIRSLICLVRFNYHKT